MLPGQHRSEEGPNLSTKIVTLRAVIKPGTKWGVFTRNPRATVKALEWSFGELSCHWLYLLYLCYTYILSSSSFPSQREWGAKHKGISPSCSQRHCFQEGRKHLLPSTMLARQTLLRELRFPAKSISEAAPPAFRHHSKMSLKVYYNVHTKSHPSLTQEGTVKAKRQTRGGGGYKDILGKEKDKSQEVGLWLTRDPGASHRWLSK